MLSAGTALAVLLSPVWGNVARADEESDCRDIHAAAVAAASALANQESNDCFEDSIAQATQVENIRLNVIQSCHDAYNRTENLAFEFAAGLVAISTGILTAALVACVALGPGAPACQAIAVEAWVIEQAEIAAGTAATIALAAIERNDCIEAANQDAADSNGQIIADLEACQEAAFQKFVDTKAAADQALAECLAQIPGATGM